MLGRKANDGSAVFSPALVPRVGNEAARWKDIGIDPQGSPQVLGSHPSEGMDGAVDPNSGLESREPERGPAE